MIGLICNKQNAPRDDSRRGIYFFAAAETDQLPLVMLWTALRPRGRVISC